jgi:hypothetical protein
VLVLGRKHAEYTLLPCGCAFDPKEIEELGAAKVVVEPVSDVPL